MSSSVPSSTANSRSISSASSQQPPAPSQCSAPPTPSKMKIFLHKVKKALKVDEAESLPEHLAYNYKKMKRYEKELREVWEAVRSVVIADPAEAARAREGQSLGTCQSSQSCSLYERLYAALGKNNAHFKKYEHYEKLVRMVWAMVLEERAHQKATEETFGRVRRFLDEDLKAVEERMAEIYEMKQAVEFKKSQAKSSSSAAEVELAEKVYKEAKDCFNASCEETSKKIEKLLATREKHGRAICQWVAARRDYHNKMDLILEKAGITRADKK